MIASKVVGEFQTHLKGLSGGYLGFSGGFQWVFRRLREFLSISGDFHVIVLPTRYHSYFGDFKDITGDLEEGEGFHGYSGPFQGAQEEYVEVSGI